jgi:hypothetical protein
MNPTQYRHEVLSTESKPDSVNVGLGFLFASLQVASAAAAVLDQVKRAIFYGEDIDQKKARDAFVALQKYSDNLSRAVRSVSYRDANDLHLADIPASERELLDTGNLDVRLLHSAIGGFTESGELLEALVPILSGKPADKANLLEEFGDGGWYAEIGLDALGFSREQRDAVNIAKLKDKKAGRYKSGGFSAREAIERDTGAERNILEQGAR